MNRRGFLSLAVWLALAALPADAAERLTIAVIPKGTTQEFWKSVHAGALQAANELGVNIIWKGPLKEDDREAQIAEVENLVSRGVSGIVLAPLDDTALRAPVRNAALEGIPVVIIDSGLKSREYVSFVATDNLRGGQLAGDHLAGLLQGHGRVVMLRYQEGSASTMAREQGFVEALARHPGIQLLSANQYGGATTESAYRASENLLAPYRTAEAGLAVDGIFCPNESTTFGMLRALQDGGLAGKVRFVGFDNSEKLVEALGLGELDGLVLPSPVRMGYLGVQTLVRYLSGEKVEKRIDTGVVLATRENMEEPEIAALLRPLAGPEEEP
ncbi:MAG: substrate-binding domain-containing protein [Candidatus Latescibacterota bacterium]